MVAESVNPVVIDMGVTKKKHIKNLKHGSGPAQTDVDRVMATVRASLAAEADGKVLVPIVMVYKKRAKRRGRGLFRGFDC